MKDYRDNCWKDASENSIVATTGIHDCTVAAECRSCVINAKASECSVAPKFKRRHGPIQQVSIIWSQPWQQSHIKKNNLIIVRYGNPAGFHPSFCWQISEENGAENHCYWSASLTVQHPLQIYGANLTWFRYYVLNMDLLPIETNQINMNMLAAQCHS